MQFPCVRSFAAIHAKISESRVRIVKAVFGDGRGNKGFSDEASQREKPLHPHLHFVGSYWKDIAALSET